jgi:alpha-beta hydrolase superfamily lysophospholipase
VWAVNSHSADESVIAEAERGETRSSTFELACADGARLFVYRWLPSAPPKAVVQIAHGLAEHAGRYHRLATLLTAHGYAVYANDHRGHGRTATRPSDLGFFAERDGWNKCVGDLWRLHQQVSADHRGRPVILIGHSMGSFLAQDFITRHGAALAGVVLSGSAGAPNALVTVARLIARLERLRLGARGKSGLMRTIAFAPYSGQFRPVRTPYDWLSRDFAEVDKYIADPLCGFRPSAQLWIDMLDALGSIADPQRQSRIPRELPIYILAGDRDPVSDNTKSLQQLVDAYWRAGVTQVTCKFYAGGRHNMFDETNRAQVIGDLLTWMDQLIARSGRS